MSTAARDSTDRFVGGIENFSSEFVANGSINGGDLVELSADNTVQQASTDGADGIGFAMFDAADGEAVTVAMTGALVRVNTATGVSAGDLVTSNGGTSAGQVATAGTTGDEVVGKAIVGESGNVSVVEVDLGGQIN